MDSGHLSQDSDVTSGGTSGKSKQRQQSTSGQSKLAKTSKMLPLISRHNKLAPNNSVGYYGIQRSEEILPENFQIFSGYQHPPGGAGSGGGGGKRREDAENQPPRHHEHHQHQQQTAEFSQPNSPMSDSANTILSSSKYESSGSGTTSKTVTDSDSEM